MANKDKSQLVLGGCIGSQEEEILAEIGFSEGQFPFRYLGVPMTANKLSKIECSQLVEKITKKIKVWATKTTLYMGRVTLINSVLLGTYNFWASIFIVP